MTATKGNVSGETEKLCHAFGLKVPSIIDATQHKSMGKKTYKMTKPLRCPHLSGLNEAVIGVSRCYMNRKQPGDLQKARNQLRALKGNEIGVQCLSSEEFTEINGMLRTLDN